MIDSLNITIQVIGKNGEFISSQDIGVLEEDQLPDQVMAITFDNFRSLQQYSNNRVPFAQFNLIFDFLKPALFDLVQNPSLATANQSKIEINSENTIWVNGAYGKILDSLKQRKNRFAWLHKRNIYDLFMWLIILPVSVYYLYKIDGWFANFFLKLSTAFNVVCYILILLFILLLFRFIFNYVRWLCPYMELKTSYGGGHYAHRLFLAALLLALFGNLITDAVRALFFTP